MGPDPPDADASLLSQDGDADAALDGRAEGWKPSEHTTLDAPRIGDPIAARSPKTDSGVATAPEPRIARPSERATQEAVATDERHPTPLSENSAAAPPRRTMRPSDETTLDAPDSDANIDEPVGIDPRIGDRLANRFTLVQMLGAGAHGVVYEAEDGSGGRPVALKLLSRLDPDELYRFKREFRVLADVSDEHLVTLHELFIDDAGAFFTMELVRGTDFLSYVRGDDFEVLDEGRLRDTLWQVCAGLQALHGFGKLHRDLKPSNVLVSKDGHVSVADFGLAEELTVTAKEHDLVGTPAYMSPEQAAGQPLSSASDWYSVGVMLYEALTGTLPFFGAFGVHMLMAKQGPEPPAPSTITEVPADLDGLCMELLRREPDERPTGTQILHKLGRRDSASWSRPQFFQALGRDDELSQMHEAFGHSRSGQSSHAAALLVHGRSGMGKTTLLDAFIEQLHDSTVVLRGRCYERESLPYKGLDTLVDELRAHLLRAPMILDPVPGAAALVQLFPVLADVPGVGDTRTAVPEDPVERRRQAVAALGEVLTQLVKRRPLVLVLDDLHWCDADTVAVLVALLRPRSRPGLLFVGSYRDEGVDQSSPLHTLTAELSRLRDELRVDLVAVEPLPTESSKALALHLLDERDDADEVAQTIAAEAEGSPLFIAELVRSVVGGRSLAEGGALTLDDVIRDRVAVLPEQARALLELCVLVADPVAQSVVAEAAGVEAVVEMFALLRSRSFVRTSGPRPEDPVEPFHDRIRTAIVATLPPESMRRGHAALAAVLEREQADPDAVAAQLLGAGEPERAGEYVARAAATAAEALAFDRAARLFTWALELVPGTRDPQRGWRRARAEALAHAGRSAEAAAAYQAAYRHAHPADMLALQRNAAEQWLRSGRIEEGMSELVGVFDALGLRLPADPRLAMAGFLYQRARVRLHGTEFVERPESEIDPQLLLRVDTTWTAATGLQQSNVIVGQYCQAQHLLLALEAGEPHRVARALGIEAVYASTSGSEGAAQVDDLLERVLGLARRLHDPRARAIAHLAAAAAALYRGRFVSARPDLERAEELLRSQCTNVAWELSMVRTYLIMVHYHLGNFEGLRHTMAATLADADERDDVHTGLLNRLAFGPMPALAVGDLDQARAILADCESQWPSQMQTSTYVYVKLLTVGRLERYARRPNAAWRAFEQYWPTIVRSLMLTKQPFRIFLLHDRACTAAWVAWDSTGARRRSMLAQAAKDARVMKKQGTRWGMAMGQSIDALVDHARGRHTRALDQALAAERGLQELDMRVFAACIKKRRGEMVGGARGRTLVEQAEQVMTDAGITALGPMTDMLLPPALGW